MNAAIERALRQVWLRRGPLARLLYPLSLVYRWLYARRAQRYATGSLPCRALPVPVVVVGNVVVGGAGKTPATIAIVRHLQDRGWLPGVVSRGHGRQSDGVREVLDTSLAADVGDEPLLIHQATQVPVFVARERALAGESLLHAHPNVDVLVCDDGLQHLALARDLEVVVFDDRGLGNGWCLPAGQLREPWPRHSAVPSLVLHQLREDAPHTTAVCTDGYVARRRLADHAVNATGNITPLHQLAQGASPLVALAGIARPEVFFDMLRQRDLPLIWCKPLPDHANLAAVWPQVQAQCPPGATVLCTEKDAVKLWPLLNAASPTVLAVPLVLSPDPAFFQALDARLSSRHGSQTPRTAGVPRDQGPVDF